MREKVLRKTIVRIGIQGETTVRGRESRGRLKWVKEFGEGHNKRERARGETIVRETVNWETVVRERLGQEHSEGERPGEKT